MFQAEVPLFPIRHHAFQKVEKRGPVVGFLEMTKFVGNNVIDGIQRSLDEAPVDHQARRRRHGRPA